jgi:putative ABC transport system permease protein
MMIGSLVIYTQYRFIQQKEIGYDREHVVTIRLPHDFPSQEKYHVMKNEWLSYTNIIHVTASGELPTNITSSSVINYEEGNTDKPLVIYRTSVDDDFLDVFGIELMAGRDLSRASISSPENALLLNESALQALGWTPEEAMGQHISGRGTVIGVIKDFHMFSLHYAIEPLMLRMQDNAWFEYISVKIRPEDIPGTLAVLENTIKQHSNFPFEYRFLDDAFDQLYKTEIRMGEIIGFFTLLSILIASMGLFGLAAFTASQRTKEIGIRKVLGASVQGIVGMLSRDFLKMVMLGFLVAIPVAWYAMSQWLQDFAYRIDLEWWMFALAGIFAMAVAFFTISSQSIKAALANPVDSLKNE